MSICIFTAVMNVYKMEGENRMLVMVLCESGCVKFQHSDTSAFMMENNAVHSRNCKKNENEIEIGQYRSIQCSIA